MTLAAPDRRQFVVGTSTLAGGLLVACRTSGMTLHATEPSSHSPLLQPNAWIRVSASGQVTCVLDRTEMGQGTMTSHLSLVAEELGVDPRSVAVQFAPPDEQYANPAFGLQMTGASNSVATSWTPLRVAAATTRDLLITAGAAHLGVTVESCTCQDGHIQHKASGRTVAFAAIAAAAAQLPVTSVAPSLKPAAQYQWLGKAVPRLDSPAKVRGQATFGIDIKLPNLLIAVVVRPPAHRATVASYDAIAAQKYWQEQRITGYVVPTSVGVALVTSSYWTAKKAADLLTLTCEGGTAADFDGDLAALVKRQGLDQPDASAATVSSRGDLSETVAQDASRVEAVYSVPYVPHLTMEPQNCTADHRGDTLELWVPTQSPEAVRTLAAQRSGLNKDQIKVNVTYIGGGFGRRLAVDYTSCAVEVSKALGKPVKVIWPREDDVRHDCYRPAMYTSIAAEVSNKGAINQWSQRIIGPSVMRGMINDLALAGMPGIVARGLSSDTLGRVADFGLSTQWFVDGLAVEGADKIPYNIPNFLLRYHYLDPGVPIGFWRSVGHSHNGFMVEGFLDELAERSKMDPLAFRQQLLAKGSREGAVLQAVADASAWGSELAVSSEGTRGRGLAVHHCFGSYCAIVVQVLANATTVAVERVWAAIDCGFVINPDQVTAQVEGGIIWALSAALKLQITFKDGATAESSFSDCDVLRMRECPDIHVTIVNGQDATIDPSGVGEVAVPPTAPALASAIFRANGQRYRSLPIKLSAATVRAAGTGR